MKSIITILSVLAIAAGVNAADGKAKGDAKGKGKGKGDPAAAFAKMDKNSDGKLSKEEFTKVLVEGRNAMPKAMDQIMNLGPVKSAGLTQDQAVDSLIAFLKAGKK